MEPYRGWVDGELLGFDLETTGVDRFNDLPVSYALLKVVRGEVVGRDAALVDPGRPIPEGATAVHGITTTRAREEGGPLAEAVEAVASALVMASVRGVPIVGMKLDYDLTIVDVQCRHLDGRGLIERGFAGPVVDALVLDRHIDRFRRGRRTLSDLCDEYGVVIGNAHDASADVEATVGVLGAMCGRYPELSAHDVFDLYRNQMAWHREWAVSFDSWRRGKGNGGLDPRDFDWPLSQGDQPFAAAG